MKKFYSLLLVLEVSKASYGQDTPFTTKTYLGIKGGITKFSVKGTEVKLRRSGGDDYVPHKDHTFGAVLSTDLNKSLQLKFEANRIVKGADHVGSSFYENKPKTVTYLQIPALIGYKLPLSSKVRLIVEGGAALNVAVVPVKYNKDNYEPGSIIETPAIMASPVGGAELGFYFNNAYLFLNYRRDFDSQKYFERRSGQYYLQHAGGNSLTLGLMFRTNKGSLKQRQAQ
ncbi:hypothetical protein [Rufibacter latericius]|uniref:Outer membrane protein beta-barrel domain-containing protein n=1 Tax=Rufibacter latericius TaxID=2487040 RepID=A0A3M9MU94_9BACT|nr:hypothetical protein [Rufibacter latericius]RNI29090.1 hypothetical protein EFB08_06570 [Rufibacter latericius]